MAPAYLNKSEWRPSFPFVTSAELFPQRFERRRAHCPRVPGESEPLRHYTRPSHSLLPVHLVDVTPGVKRIEEVKANPDHLGSKSLHLFCAFHFPLAHTFRFQL